MDTRAACLQLTVFFIGYRINIEVEDICWTLVHVKKTPFTADHL
jgi:hypothetical protein